MLLKNPNWKKYNILGLLDVCVNYFLEANNNKLFEQRFAQNSRLYLM
jgi:hypothetical protein